MTAIAARPVPLTFPLHSFLRLASLAIVVLFIAFVPRDDTANAVITSVGFAHYALSLIYARKQIERVVAQPRVLLLCPGLTLFAFALYFGRFSLLLYFGIHHVFNEVYLLDRVARPSEAHRQTLLRALHASRVALNFCLYLAILRAEPELLNVPRPLLFGSLIACAVAFFFLLMRVRRGLNATQLVELCAFEVVGLVLLGLSRFTHIGFLDIVLYHFVFWGFYPLPMMARKGQGEVMRYVAWNAGLSALFLALSPLGWGRAWGFNPWLSQFYLWSYLHITLSFALSSAQPKFLTRLFSTEIHSQPRGTSTAQTRPAS